jgi:hypothetical protein
LKEYDRKLAMVKSSGNVELSKGWESDHLTM